MKASLMDELSASWGDKAGGLSPFGAAGNAGSITNIITCSYSGEALGRLFPLKRGSPWTLLFDKPFSKKVVMKPFSHEEAGEALALLFSLKPFPKRLVMLANSLARSQPTFSKGKVKIREVNGRRALGRASSSSEQIVGEFSCNY